MPFVPDHLPPRLSQMRRAVASKELMLVEYRWDMAHRDPFGSLTKAPSPPAFLYCESRLERSHLCASSPLFERRIANAARPRGIPIRRGGFSLAPLVLIAAPRPGQFRSFDNSLRPIENLDPIFPFAERVVPSEGSRAKSADE